MPCNAASSIRFGLSSVERTRHLHIDPFAEPAGKGWNVIATMRRPGQSIAAANVLVERLDVQDGESIQRAVDAGIDRSGAIGVLVNNAGYGQYGLFEALSREDIQRNSTSTCLA